MYIIPKKKWLLLQQVEKVVAKVSFENIPLCLGPIRFPINIHKFNLCIRISLMFKPMWNKQQHFGKLKKVE